MNDAPPIQRRRPLLISLLLLAVVVFLAYETVRWGVMRVYVPQDKALLVINKYGDPLPPDRIVAPKAEPTRFKGVQEEVRGPGRYFINPVLHETELVDLIEISAGDPNKWTWDPDGNLMNAANVAPMVGMVTLQEGKTPEGGQEVVAAGFKGLQHDVLTPGTYKINPRQQRVVQVPAVIVPPG